MISKRVDVKRVGKEVPRDLEEIAAKLLQVPASFLLDRTARAS
jgi:hypothetical protein